MSPQDAQPAKACYFDGYVDKRRAVALIFGPALEIVENGVFIVAWPYADIRRIPSPGGLMRLRAVGAPRGAWLETDDARTQSEIARRCLLLAGEQPRVSRDAGKRLVIALAATALFGAFLWGGVPRMAGVIAPLIPLEWEKKIGEGADAQVRATFSGETCAGPKGAAALKKFSQRLQEGAHLRLPATIEVISSKIPNAFALPGGKVYLLSGLLSKARSQDEVLGVLAHELGHLEHRDHLRRIIATGGTALLVGMIFGDVTGGGAMIVISRTLLYAAHSRETEAQADDFAAQTLARLGRPTRPMGELLLRITGKEKDDLLSVLNDHPMSEDRLAKLVAADKGAKSPPLLSDEEWKALQSICD